MCLLCHLAFTLIGANAQQLSGKGAKARAMDHLAAERYGEAIRVLDSVVAANPVDADGYYLRGICHERRGQLANAVMDYRKASMLTPDNREMLTSLRRAENAWHSEISTKLDGYKRELALNPGDDSYKRKLAGCYADLGKYSEAEAWYDQYFASRKGNTAEILAFADVLVQAHKLSRAENVVRTGLDHFPDNARLYTQLGCILLWSGKNQQALGAFEKALRADPANPVAGKASRKHAGHPRPRSPRPATARASHERSLPPAMDYYSRLVRINPADHESRFMLAQELAKSHRFTEASEQLDTLANVFARSERLRAAREMVRALRDSVYRFRISQAVRRLANNPLDKQTVLELADYYDQLQMYDSTRSVLDAYARLTAPRVDPDIRFASAQYAAWNNEFVRAIAELDSLLKREPAHVGYQLLRAQIAVWTVSDLALAERYLRISATTPPRRSRRRSLWHHCMS